MVPFNAGEQAAHSRGQRRQSGSTTSGVTSWFTCGRVFLSSGSPMFMFSAPDCNTSDGAFLCGVGDHQKTTLIARFQPDAAVPPRAEDVVVFSLACSTFSVDGNDWKDRVQTEWASEVLSTPKHILLTRRTHLRTGSRLRSSQIPATSETSQTNVREG